MKNKKILKQARFLFVPLVKASSLLVFFICLYCLFQYIGVDIPSFMALTEEYVLSIGGAGLFVFFVLSALGTFFFVPRQLLSLVAGYFYGVWVALFVVSCGVGLGCLFSMGYGNFLAKNFFQKNMRKRIHCLENIFTKSTFGIALGIRILQYPAQYAGWGNENSVLEVLGRFSPWLYPAKFYLCFAGKRGKNRKQHNGSDECFALRILAAGGVCHYQNQSPPIYYFEIFI